MSFNIKFKNTKQWNKRCEISLGLFIKNIWVKLCIFHSSAQIIIIVCDMFFPHHLSLCFIAFLKICMTCFEFYCWHWSHSWYRLKHFVLELLFLSKDLSKFKVYVFVSVIRCSPYFQVKSVGQNSWIGPSVLRYDHWGSVWSLG